MRRFLAAFSFLLLVSAAVFMFLSQDKPSELAEDAGIEWEILAEETWELVDVESGVAECGVGGVNFSTVACKRRQNAAYTVTTTLLRSPGDVTKPLPINLSPITEPALKPYSPMRNVAVPTVGLVVESNADAPDSSPSINTFAVHVPAEVDSSI